MIILSVDTALGQESCSILQYGQIIAFSQGTENSLQAEKLFDHINKVLAQTKLKFEDVDYFAANIGPGSFTGIRIGLSALLGICQAQDKKFIGVSSLEALAYKVTARNKTISVALDAHRDQAYFGEYDFNGDVIKELYKPILVDIEKIILADIGNIKDCRVQSVPDARDIGNVAYSMIKNKTADFSRKSPIYIREPDAKISEPKINVQ